jgi:predicted O-linked N-acetylglucosamine transferase (SPINDLY family)
MADGAGPWAPAWEAIRSNRPAEAEQLCRQTLAGVPDSVEGWFLFGVASQSQGKLDQAAEGYGRVLRLQPALMEAHNNLGNVLRDLGRLAAAADCFAQAVRLRPDHPEIRNNLGNALRQLGRRQEAGECYAAAVRLRPDYPEGHYNLGTVLWESGQLAEAESHLRRTLDLWPDLPEALLNLGNVLRDQRRLDEAVACFRRALMKRPDYAEAHNNLGSALLEQRRPAEAAECCRQALRLRPNFPQAQSNLGAALRNLGQFDAAAECFRQALAVWPESPDAHHDLGSALREMRRPADAVECFRQALALRPNYPEAHHNLGIALRDLARPSEAAECFRRALALRPDLTEALISLGLTVQELGQPAEATECFRRALAQRPQSTAAHDGLLMSLHYRADITLTELVAAHAEYDHIHAAPLRTEWRPHANDRDPDRPLRLGFVSADLGRHPVGFFLVRAVEALARRAVALVCYSSRMRPADDVTARFQAASVWRDVTGLSDDRLAELVRADGIDVLIDLAGHTAGNRLLAFARKPAPVQATWLGYEGATGLEATDYLIADERLVPSGTESEYRARVLRLQGGYACYDPPSDAPEPGPLPALASGRVTFGCFNNPAKLSPPALAAFAEVLRRVPDVRLVLQFRGLDEPATVEQFRGHFAVLQVDPARVEMRGRSSYAEYLAAYRGIDIALDPFPFNGGATTCDALWMGVPVVTLPGATFASRHGLSHLTGVGLGDELVAHDVDEYAARAVNLARDLDRLARLRAELREKMARSPLCNGDRLAAELLAALRTAWRAWTTNCNPANH